MSPYSGDEMLDLARAARLVLAMLQDDADGVAAIAAEIGDDPPAWRNIAMDLAGSQCEYMYGQYGGEEGAIREAMRLIAWRLDRAGNS